MLYKGVVLPSHHQWWLECQLSFQSQQPEYSKGVEMVNPRCWWLFVSLLLQGDSEDEGYWYWQGPHYWLGEWLSWGTESYQVLRDCPPQLGWTIPTDDIRSTYWRTNHPSSPRMDWNTPPPILYLSVCTVALTEKWSLFLFTTQWKGWALSSPWANLHSHCEVHRQDRWILSTHCLYSDPTWSMFRTQPSQGGVFQGQPVGWW